MTSATLVPMMRRFLVRVGPIAAAIVMGATFVSTAGAQCPAETPLPGEGGCYSEDADWYWQRQLFDAIDFDSGWVPAGAPLQVRATFQLAGETQIAMGGAPTASWPEPIEVQIPGRDGTGYFSINYGMETHAYFRFNVEVAGIRYRFEDEIDIPFIPADLRFADEADFDPFELPPGLGVMLDDRTSRFALVELDLAGPIGIPGVGGGFRLDTEGELRAHYRTTTIVVRDADPILMEDDLTVVGSDLGGEEFGASKDLWVHPEGVLDYDGALVFFPTIFLDVVGIDFDYPLAEIPIDILSIMNDVVFDDVLVHVPLPDIDLPVLDAPGHVDFGVVEVGAPATEQVVRIANEGEATLEAILTVSEGFALSTPARISVPPRSSVSAGVLFRAAAEGPLMGSLDFRTNDPDEPMVSVPLLATAIAMELPDAGPSDGGFGDAGPDASFEDPGYSGGACGCRTVNGTEPAMALGFLFALTIWRRRR